MGWFSDLRTTVLLRRIARASERQATAMEQLASIEQQRWESASIKLVPRKAVISSFNLEEAEKDYAARLERSSG